MSYRSKHQEEKQKSVMNHRELMKTVIGFLCKFDCVELAIPRAMLQQQLTESDTVYEMKVLNLWTVLE
jgi:hypothetical protein